MRRVFTGVRGLAVLLMGLGLVLSACQRAVGMNTAGANTVGESAVGESAAGTNTAGANAVGENTTGTNTAGASTMEENTGSSASPGNPTSMEDKSDSEEGEEMEFEAFTKDSTVADVISDPAFGDFGRLLFPVDIHVPDDLTMEEVSSSQIYLWYSNIQTEKTLDILNSLKAQALSGEPVFYRFYSEEEMEADPSKRDTGLFFFRGEPGKEFAVTNAGGGFYYVGAMHDSFSHALELSRKGYNAFALIYRPDDPYMDLARAIAYLYDHADELQIQKEGYSLWGGSAGARMAAVGGNREYLWELTGREDIPQAAAVIMQYTGYSNVSAEDAPTYACVGTRDGIASWRTMERRLNSLENLGIPTEFHAYEGLGHGFGLGTGTVADGWLEDAVNFWQEQLAR